MRMLLLCLSLILATRAASAELSSFIWNEDHDAAGMTIEGALSWEPVACDFTRNDYETRDFPRFSHKAPSSLMRMKTQGSYCFVVQLPEERLGTSLHFSMIRVFGTAELLINQERVWFQDGNTGPRQLTFLHDVQASRLQIELRLRCSESPSCGFRGTLHIRDQRQGTREELLHGSYDLLAITGILACLFYHLIFAFLRRRSSAALFLTINAVALILRLTLTGQSQLHYRLGINETLYWRLELLAVFILLPSTLSLVRSIFEEETPAWLPTLGWVIGLTGCAFLILDNRIFLFGLSLSYIMVSLNFFNHGIVGYRAVRRQRSGAYIFVVSGVITFTSALFEVLNSRLNIEMHAFIQPLSYLATMIFQSVLLATRINDAFTLAEQQETEIKSLKEKIEVEIRSLDQRILERTMELRTIFQSISTGILWISRGEDNALNISSEYSDHLRKTIGFDVQAWHEMHFFLRRLRLADIPPSGKDLQQWFRQEMDDKDKLDPSLEKLLGGRRVFDDIDHVKHLKFKWIPIIEGQSVSELFIFVFDVSASIAMQELALYKALEIEALRELTRLEPPLIEALHEHWSDPAWPALRPFGEAHELKALSKAMSGMQTDEQFKRFLDGYRRVLALLAARQRRRRESQPFDRQHFLHLPDWQNLSVESRTLFQELVRQHERS